ncbi:phosphatidylethanolamine-binding protein [Parasitella parasitica]|nr:phosphatidylethanolamine-binding protein [Parasitella parasitica]
MPLVTMEMNLGNALKNADISPNIIPEKNDFPVQLQVKFTSGEDVALGNFIEPSKSADIPELTFIGLDETAEYTLLLVDPDAPCKEDPKWGPYRHWVVVNIPGSGKIDEGRALSPYMGPAPPPQTRDHRYIFLLYKQPKTQADFGILAEDRAKWDFKTFVNENELELVGVNFFVSRNNDN